MWKLSIFTPYANAPYVALVKVRSLHTLKQNSFFFFYNCLHFILENILRYRLGKVRITTLFYWENNFIDFYRVVESFIMDLKVHQFILQQNSSSMMLSPPYFRSKNGVLELARFPFCWLHCICTWGYYLRSLQFCSKVLANFFWFSHDVRQRAMMLTKVGLEVHSQVHFRWTPISLSDTNWLIA